MLCLPDPVLPDEVPDGVERCCYCCGVVVDAGEVLLLQQAVTVLDAELHNLLAQHRHSVVKTQLQKRLAFSTTQQS